MGEKERHESWQRGKEVFGLLLGALLLALFAVGLFGLNGYVP